MDISRITKVIMKNIWKKIGKITPLTIKNIIFEKKSKFLISYDKFSQPKYHIPWNPKFTSVIWGKKNEKMRIQSVKM